MTFGSLFAGIGGFDLGLERAGMTCRWQVENDPYCQRVLAKHWPDVGQWDDVRTFPPAPTNEWPVDLICGGFPCQDVSDAGNKTGIGGSRSGLWFEFARIIGILRPRFVLVENVTGLLVRGMDRVLGGLAACGYDAEWEVLAASDVGAPHIRERVFVVAYSQCDQLRVESRGLGRAHWKGEAVAGDNGPHGYLADSAVARSRRLPVRPGESREETIDPDGEGAFFSANEGIFGRHEEGRPRLERCEWWSAEPSVGRMANGVPKRVDRLRCLGNAVVPQVAEWIGRRILKNER